MGDDNEKILAVKGETDSLLVTLIRLVNLGHHEQGITVLTGGFLISGLLTGGAKYFSEFAEQLKSGFQQLGTDDLANTMAEKYREMGERYKPKESSENDSEPEGVVEIRYLHLRNARIWHPGGEALPGVPGALMRIRLEEIDGFFLGELSPQRH